jgi:hypothetical protein
MTMAKGFAPPEPADPYKGLSSDYSTFLRANQQQPSPQSYKGWQDSVLAQKKAGATNVVTNIQGPQTPGQKKVDENFAQEYVDFVASGGYADVQKNVGQLKEVINTLETKGGITGPGVGYIPEFLQPLTSPDAVAAREAVEEVVQRNLRLVLGAQFTQKEGERLISRSFNPKLGPKENSKRITRLIGQIEAAAEAKADAARYFEENGTLAGWTGKVFTANDFMADRVPDVNEPPMAGAKKAADGNWYVEKNGKFFRVEQK